MSECHFWWRAGDTQWCDMMGDACHCHGWEESCDMRNEKQKVPQARLVAHMQKTKSKASGLRNGKPKRAA